MLRVEKLSYEIKGRKLLKDISFQIRRGEVLAVLGANGAGKSTLMGLLCGDKKPTEGTIFFNGRELSDYDTKDLAKCRALLSQQQQMALAFKVSEIVMMGRYPHFRSNPSAQDKEIVEEVMELCGVQRFADRPFLSLSGGEQQRVQLARVLAQIWDNADGLLLLDEPISALDLQYQQKVLAVAKALAKRGFMVILIVHDVNFAAMYADRIIMLKNGRKLIDGTPVEVLNAKDIYTIFSVESAVELNAKTLKPYVKLEELVLDASIFNSSLPAEPNISIERRIEQEIERHPYLSIDELADRLEVSALEACCLDKRNRTARYTFDREQLCKDLPSLGKVRVCSRSTSVRHSLVGNYVLGTSSDTRQIRFEGDIDLLVLLENWHIGVFIENEFGKSIRFFDNKGDELHAAYLIDGQSHLAYYDGMKSASLPGVELREVLNPIPRAGASACLKEPAPGLEDSISRLRQILASCASNKMPLSVKLLNPGGHQSFCGVVHNLVDQGRRYMIKESVFELDILWNGIGRITYGTQNKEPQNLEVALFDRQGDLVLNLCTADRTAESVLGEVKCKSSFVI